MKIAIVEPYIEGTGGGQKVIAEYASFLQKQGHKVEIFTARRGKSPYKEFDRIKINIFGSKSKFLSPFVFLFKKIRGFNIIIANDFPSNFISIFNKDVVWVCYTPKRDFYDLAEFSYNQSSLKGKIILILKKIMFRKIDHISAQRADLIMAASQNVASRVSKYYQRKAKIVRHGIDSSKFKEGKFEDYVLSIARLVPPKRVDKIIESMQYVKNKKVKLYVVGDGPDKDKILDLCKKYKNVVYLGDVDQKKLLNLYSNCLAAVYVPVREDWGLVPLEAAASGKPTIGVNEGGLKETILNGKTGFLLNGAEPREIARKIDLLANNKRLAQKMGKSAKKYALQFDWKNSLYDFEKVLLKSKLKSNS